jgi:RNA polymerase sigma-70 factor (ECF subfamily)
MSAPLADPAWSHRRALVALAYRLLGSVSAAEDAVQDGYERWSRADRDAVLDAKGWLVTTVTRLCIDRLRGAASERAAYAGPWLPEPLATDPEEPFDRVALAESLGLAFLHLLERLGPTERAAFILHEAFDYDHRAIAAILGKSEAAARQIVHRARTRVRAERPRFDPDPDEQRRLLGAFLGATARGDVDALAALLARDAMTYTDGGGKATAALNPIRGADRIARFFIGLRRKRGYERAGGEIASLNGAPGLLLRADGGAIVMALSLDVADGLIQSIRVIRNPDKLARLR